MNEEIFRRSHYKVAIDHVKVEVKEKTVTREYRPDGISEEDLTHIQTWLALSVVQ